MTPDECELWTRIVYAYTAICLWILFMDTTYDYIFNRKPHIDND